MFKKIIFGGITFLLFIFLTILANWIGLQKEFFITLCVLGSLSLIFGVSNFSWGIARRKGIEYFWYLIFSIVIFYAIFINLFQIIETYYLDLPWVLSIFIAISPIILMIIAYFFYKFTASDNVKAGVLAFLISLLAGQTAGMQIDKTIVKKLSLNSKTISNIDEILGNTPVLSKGVNYLKKNYSTVYKSTTKIGSLGEHITNRLLTSQGYKKIASKFKGNQGIDHIFAKYGKNMNIKKVQIVETKINNSQLRPNQMTSNGIIERIDKLLSKTNISSDERKIYLFIKENINTNKVSKQLYHHDTYKNITTISKLGPNQDIVKKSSFENKLINQIFN